MVEDIGIECWFRLTLNVLSDQNSSRCFCSMWWTRLRGATYFCSGWLWICRVDWHGERYKQQVSNLENSSWCSGSLRSVILVHQLFIYRGKVTKYFQSRWWSSRLFTAWCVSKIQIKQLHEVNVMRLFLWPQINALFCAKLMTWHDWRLHGDTVKQCFLPVKAVRILTLHIGILESVHSVTVTHRLILAQNEAKVLLKPQLRPNKPWYIILV